MRETAYINGNGGWQMKKELRIMEFLLQHADSHTVSFHMPGHKGSAIYKRFGYDEFLEKFMDCDITEIPGADNLFQAEGIIKNLQDKYRELYGVSHSYLLINGTSGGIIASILATVPAGGQLVMARNCHKSVFNALTLGGKDKEIIAYQREENSGSQTGMLKLVMKDTPMMEAPKEFAGGYREPLQISLDFEEIEYENLAVFDSR
jgi:arginine/lysine/ornithine decarboxylase